MTTYIMNPIDNRVATAEEWAAEGFSLETHALIEVEQASDGKWTEVEPPAYLVAVNGKRQGVVL